MHVCTHARTHARSHTFMCTTNCDKFRSNRFGVASPKIHQNIWIYHKYAYPIMRILIAYHFNRTLNDLAKRFTTIIYIQTDRQTHTQHITTHMLCIENCTLCTVLEMVWLRRVSLFIE